jgi:mannose-1-phosphate guanylyltransferase
MSMKRQTWAVVLAAGQGTRLSALTTDASGRSVPKQFCSLDGGHSLLQEALQRAQRVAPPDRVCAVVAADHRRYWKPTLRDLPATNVITQPHDRGTANGVLLAILRILERDLLARIVFLPADHYVRDERSLAGSVRAAVSSPACDADRVMLLGIQPEEADPELGYIVPGPKLADGTRGVARFVEKPPIGVARQLLREGALWNSFIFAANGRALLAMIHHRVPDVVEQMATAIGRDAQSRTPTIALANLYDSLPKIDFSRAIIQGAENVLRVVSAPPCGWSDLGTPARVAQTLQRLSQELLERASSSRPIARYVDSFALMNLAAQQSRLESIKSMNPYGSVASPAPLAEMNGGA